ncbi:MAG: serine/threonine protein kinase [bacterium]|nr:serine/threonine protein kinase [bacterium]
MWKIHVEENKYEIDSESMGQGGMGVVYKGRDTAKNCDVVVKFPKESEDFEFFRLKEGKAIGLDHSNIVKAHSFSEIEINSCEGDIPSGVSDVFKKSVRVPCIVMEYIDGWSLDELIDHYVPGRETVQIRLNLFEQILDAVVYLHGQNIIHRDLKPKNIMVTKKGNIKIIDFGLLLEGEVHTTQSRIGIGTIPYVPPEQLVSLENTDARADIYSLGAILYELLTGQKLDWLLSDNGQAPLVRDINPYISDKLTVLVARCLEKNPGRRFGSALALKNDFDKRKLKPFCSGAELPELPSYLKVGDCFHFGRYPQWVNGEVESITWRVLKHDSDGLLVISEKVLDVKPYNEELVDTTWDNCTLRHWLNRDFFEQAFNKQERSFIVKTNNLGDNAGPSTDDDRIFLLSIEEAENLFSSDKDRMAKPTVYAIKNSAIQYGKNTDWWLRSSITDDKCADCVYDDGRVNGGGRSVTYEKCSIRPVLRLSASCAEFKYAVDYVNAQEGERFLFGKYRQGPNGEVEPIVWRVLKRGSKSLLVVSEKGLDAKPYYEKLLDVIWSEKPYDEILRYVTWSNCTLRAWLNGEFLGLAFSEQEQSLIKTKKNRDEAGHVTKDRIFLLSIKDVEKFFSNDKDRMVKPTAYATVSGAFTGADGIGWWWLRSRGNHSDCAAYVDDDGLISFYRDVDYFGGSVRPAFLLAI